MDIELTLAAVTTISLTLAFVMGLVAWRLVREERKRSDARISEVLAKLAAHSRRIARDGTTPAPDARTTVEHVERPLVRATEDRAHELLPQIGTVAGSRPTRDLSRGRQAPRRSFLNVPVRSLLFMTATAVLVVAIVAPGLLIRPEAPMTETSGAPLPVELLSLSHTKQGNYLTIAGSVRNPLGGTTRAMLSVSATVLDGAGGVIGSGQTPLPVAVLQPGGETAFTISLPDADAINRYRISFLEDQTSLPHIDRRQPDEQALSTTARSGT
ncbi:MAG: hypothetical protein VYE68_11625 [Acidobacteriota bacterium]|nr:hypothetical protein [Acidobacteriota bacterium]